ncbi:MULTISPECIES: metalloregulator ArsR/SmtB family transcription factor [Paenibacillus]|uniref:Metalloregulator ArsR/SmtB family transcription factor n=1 Tax=Paenibacillus campinasensis TaxID=66347 RepID=A0A268EHC4_9BACL|nr:MULTISPECIES: metalloregulator ArsR/SmtB family transcription factor [Paenibacillus]MUG68187.1 metalloregulator ArsR/SmtB family transcription factor [Paenibacillus campinasensis]PAD72489.1 transcriptional regulator [Paenibacillus campinasensis]PAK49096.1 transcriptional regulator [Paenibacillus sp. 7541]
MSDIYRAISDPIRRQILNMLAERELPQLEIVKSFTISQPAIKKHLAILLEEKLVLERREGKYCFYRLNTPVFEVEYQRLQNEIGRILDNKLNRLKQYLEEES